MKRLLAVLLTVALLCSALFCVPAAAEASVAESEDSLVLQSAFAADLVSHEVMPDDGHIGIPVTLTNYVRPGVTPNGRGIMYLVGSGAAHPGTESDVSIVEDFLKDGYHVTVADYGNDPAAKGEALAWSIQSLHFNYILNGKYTAGFTAKGGRSHIIPAGCRLASDIFYYDIATMSYNGINEYIIDVFNTYYAGKRKGNDGEFLSPATSLETCVKKDGTPIDTTLVMDIVYPSQPKETVPVFALASSSETFYQSAQKDIRPYYPQALVDGYAAVCYQHEYIPMSRDDHYGYLDDAFTLTYYMANLVHSAAIRRIRYLQDEFGYNADYISVFGFSKSSLGPAILSDTNHENIGDYRSIAPYCPQGKDPTQTVGPQPWLTYEGTDTPISSNVTAVYSGSGPGLCNARGFTVTKTSVPVACSIGNLDDIGGFRWQISSVRGYLDQHPGESLFLEVDGMDHQPAYGYDKEKEVELFHAWWTFLDNHVRAAYRAEPPQVLWMKPKSGQLFNDADVPVEVEFSRAMDLESLNKGITVYRHSDGTVIPGTWTATHGNTTCFFESPYLIPGSKYTVTVTTQAKAADGVAVAEPFSKTFAVSGDEALTADRNVSGNGNTKAGLTLSDGGLPSLVHFTRETGFADVTKAYLIFSRVKGGDTQIAVGRADNDWDGATMNTAAHAEQPFASTDSDTLSVILDVTDAVQGQKGKELSFALSTAQTARTSLNNNFNDTSASFSAYSQYRLGGGNMTVSFVNDGPDGSRCLALTGRDNDSRIKFLNALKVGTLTEEMIGQHYKASFKIKAAGESDLFCALYGTTALSGLGETDYHIAPDRWYTLTYDVAITKEMVEQNAVCFTVNLRNSVDFYLDDVSVWQEDGNVSLGSLQQADTTLPPTMVLFTPESHDADLYHASRVAGGSLNTTDFAGDPLILCGKTIYRVNGCTKGYLSIPLSDYSDTDTATLCFKASANQPQTLSVYGVNDTSVSLADYTWNEAPANVTDGPEVDLAAVYGGKPLGTVDPYTNGTHEVDVSAYVRALKQQGAQKAVFLLVAENQTNTYYEPFDGRTEVSGYSTTGLGSKYPHGLTTDPTDPDNQVFYFTKSGSQSGDNGYYQNVCFTGLLGTNGKWTDADIGDSYVVSFRQYIQTDGSNCGVYGNIGSPGSNDYTLTSGVAPKRTVTRDGYSESSPANKWVDVTYTFTVTKEMVTSYPGRTGIIIASGWPATAVYVDDLQVSRQKGDVSVAVRPEVLQPSTVGYDFSGELPKTAGSPSSCEIYVSADPDDPTNSVLAFDRKIHTESAYPYAMTVAGLFGVTRWTADDIGKTYTISYRQFNYCPDGQTACGTYYGLAGLGADIWSKRDGFVTGSSRSLGNAWQTLNLSLTVTQDLVDKYPTATSLIFGCGYIGEIIYIDDLSVTMTPPPPASDITPYLAVTTETGSSYTIEVNESVLIDGGTPATGTSPDTMVIKQPQQVGARDGLSKVYATFDVGAYHYIKNGTLTVRVPHPVAGQRFTVFGLNAPVSNTTLTWITAAGNDDGVGANPSSVFAGQPLAEVTMTDATTYDIPVDDFAVSMSGQSYITFLICPTTETDTLLIDGLQLALKTTPDDTSEATLTIDTSPAAAGDRFYVLATYALGQQIDTLTCTVNGKPVTAEKRNGDSFIFIGDFAEGDNTVTATLTLTDGSVVSKTVTLSTTACGDTNADGIIDTTDLLLMKKCLAGLIEESDCAAGIDANRDGTVDTTDLLLLKKYLAGLIDTLG